MPIQTGLNRIDKAERLVQREFGMKAEANIDKNARRVGTACTKNRSHKPKTELKNDFRALAGIAMDIARPDSWIVYMVACM